MAERNKRKLPEFSRSPSPELKRPKLCTEWMDIFKPIIDQISLGIDPHPVMHAWESEGRAYWEIETENTPYQPIEILPTIEELIPPPLRDECERRVAELESWAKRIVSDRFKELAGLLCDDAVIWNERLLPEASREEYAAKLREMNEWIVAKVRNWLRENPTG